MYGPGSAEAYDEYLEGIFGDIGRALSSAGSDVGRFVQKAAPQVGRFIQQAAPAVASVGLGALQGAAAGSAAGLPGIIAGAALGGAGAGLSKYGSGAAKNIGGALSGITNIASQFSPLGRAGGIVSALAGGKGGAGATLSALGGLAGGGGGGAVGNVLGALTGGGGQGGAGAAINAIGSLLGGSGAGGAGGAVNALTSLFGGSSAAGQLLSLLQRPEAMQALAALNLGPAGRRTIPVGSAQTPLPVSAVANVVKELAEQTSNEAAALADGSEAELHYMTNSTGEFVGYPASERERAARVWELLNEAQAERVLNILATRVPAEQQDEAYYDESDQQEADFYDTLDLYAEDMGEDIQEDILEDVLRED